RTEGGFTLLEVMIALAILALSLTVISQADVNSVRAVGRSKQITIATQLARWLMTDTEDLLFDEGFQDFEEEKKGDFGEQGFKQFRYVLKIDKIELPPNLNAQSLSNAVSNTGSGAGSGSRVGGMFQAGAKMMGQQFEMIRNVLEQSIRRVTVRVVWEESGRERFISVSGYFTDPRKVDSAGGLLGAAAAAAGNKSTSASGNTSTTPSTSGAGSPAGIRR
ncbi:MAG: type II secretion system protein, partial [Myxococcales bacterium]|nr:type II secretion system protein [Myxococcales bacterium]